MVVFNENSEYFNAFRILRKIFTLQTSVSLPCWWRYKPRYKARWAECGVRVKLSDFEWSKAHAFNTLLHERI